MTKSVRGRHLHITTHALSCQSARVQFRISRNLLIRIFYFIMYAENANLWKERWCIVATLALPHRRMELRAIGVDVDGVLRNTGYLAYLAAAKTIAELGGSSPTFADYVHEYESDVLTYYSSRGVKEELEKIDTVFFRHANMHDDTPPFDDVRDFLAHAQSRDVTVFAVSGHPTEQLHEWFVTQGIDDHLFCIFGGSRDKRACITNACKKIGVDHAMTCYVGDWGVDMRAARGVGVVPIGITRGYETRTILESNDAAHVIDHLHELSPLIG